MTLGTASWTSFLAGSVLVLVRMSALVMSAPVFSSTAIPARIKALFVLSVSFLVAPIVAALPHANLELGMQPVLGEVAVGLLFGLSLSLLSEMLNFAGAVLGIQFSFSLVNLLDPNSPVQEPLLGQMFSLLETLVLLGAGLHRTLLAAFLRGFAAVPVGTAVYNPRAGLELVGMASGIFLAALQLAAPVLACTFLVEFTVALLSRLSPQLPVMSITVPAKTITGYIVLIGSIALWPQFLEGRFVRLLDCAQRVVLHAVSA